MSLPMFASNRDVFPLIDAIKAAVSSAAIIRYCVCSHLLFPF